MRLLLVGYPAPAMWPNLILCNNEAARVNDIREALGVGRQRGPESLRDKSSNAAGDCHGEASSYHRGSLRTPFWLCGAGEETGSSGYRYFVFRCGLRRGKQLYHLQ